MNGISSSQHKAVLRDWESGKPAVSHEREPLISEKTRTSVVIDGCCVLALISV